MMGKGAASSRGSRHRCRCSEGTRQDCSFVSQSFAFREIVSGCFF